MKPVISVKGLSKRYSLGSEFITGQSFREMIVGALASPFRKFRRLSGNDASQEKFWALKDVSFEVQSGEIIGVIGRNGAGKSTLLKVLSRITSPTTGRIEYCGRMTSLLEVGTGFHPELTGRENIFLNGAILGLSRKEINQRINDIVAFAEIDAFLDTPVKRYSSGMYIRLAFSVAAHLETDILVIDEVLAVGDSAFQKKCLGKIKDIASGGRTVFFVSHNTAAVARLCTRGIWLDKGVVRMDDDIQSVLNAYDMSGIRNNDAADSKLAENNSVSIRSILVSGNENDSRSLLSPNSECVIKISGANHTELPQARISIGVYDDAGTRLCLLNSNNTGYALRQGIGDFSICCKISALPLTAGRYTINTSITQGADLIIGIERAAVFYVNEDSSRPSSQASFGPLLLDESWH